MWTCHDFSATQILREISFGESSRTKNGVFAIFGALNFFDCVNFNLQKVQKFISKFRTSKYVKMAFFELLESLKLISRRLAKFPRF